MSTIEQTQATQAMDVHHADDASAETSRRKRPSLLRFAWWTVPLHALMPFGFWWLLLNDPSLLGEIFWKVHFIFPVLLLVSVPWWWDRIGQLIALLTINHVVTVVVLLFLTFFAS